MPTSSLHSGSNLEGQSESISDCKQAKVDPHVSVELLVQLVDALGVHIIFSWIDHLTAPKCLVITNIKREQSISRETEHVGITESRGKSINTKQAFSL